MQIGKKFFAAAVLLTVSLFATQTVSAQLVVSAAQCTADQNAFLLAINIKDGRLIPCECTDTTNCNLNSVFQLIVNITQLILAMTGSLALLMVIYGGAMFIIAAGSPERIQKAKQILVAASIGVAVIFSAWLIVNIVIGALTDGAIHSEAKIFDRFWFNQPSG